MLHVLYRIQTWKTEEHLLLGFQPSWWISESSGRLLYVGGLAKLLSSFLFFKWWEQLHISISRRSLEHSKIEKQQKNDTPKIKVFCFLTDIFVNWEIRYSFCRCYSLNCFLFLITLFLNFLLSYWHTILGRRDRLPSPVFLGFPSDLNGKESACHAGDVGSISGVGRSFGEGNSYPLQCSGLENLYSLDPYTVHGFA